MTSHETLGVAVIGTGRMGADHVRRINEVISGARVAAVVDIDADRVKHLADGIDGCTPYTDPAAAMDDPAVDAVLIASPGPAHEATLLDAFARDLPGAVREAADAGRRLRAARPGGRAGAGAPPGPGRLHAPLRRRLPHPQVPSGAGQLTVAP